MKTDHPSAADIPALRRLWKIAFEDSDSFLDVFFDSAFSPDRCRCIWENGALAAALYWFDCRVGAQKTAYIYAVATDPDFRGRGLCRALMTDTAALLQSRSYASALLVPGDEGLSRMYGAMGYIPCTQVREFSCTAGENATAIRTLSPEEYAKQRQEQLPAGGVVQDGDNLVFLQKLANFYAGDDFLLAAELSGDRLQGIELLGNAEKAPDILHALGASAGSFRCPGDQLPFAMFLPLQEDAVAPTYFGLAFD